MSSPRLKGPKQETRRTRSKQEMDDGRGYMDFRDTVTGTGTIARTIGYNIQQIKSTEMQQIATTSLAVFSIVYS